MLLSLALIFLIGLTLGKVFELMKLPPLVGMLIAGVLIGSFGFDLLDDSILNISADLRKIALIIILIRAGLNLNIADLKAVGRPAFLMCFLPAIFEISAITLLAPLFFDITYLEAVLIGTVTAAVSPAVIVPRMIKLNDEGYSPKIVQTVMAGAAVDDIFVIILFTAVTGLLTTGQISALSFITIPTSIIFGLFVGIIIGFALLKFFKKFRMRDTVKVIIMLSIAFILVTIEDALTGVIGFSGLLAVMTFGAVIKFHNIDLSTRLAKKYSALWSCAEIWLFVLVGAIINVDYALKAGISVIILLLLVLIIRVIGVFFCFAKTSTPMRERLFAAFSYIPKATVQAAIGSIPLTLGLDVGQTVLTVAVLSIIITAPIGALLIDNFASKLLRKE